MHASRFQRPLVRPFRRDGPAKRHEVTFLNTGRKGGARERRRRAGGRLRSACHTRTKPPQPTPPTPSRSASTTTTPTAPQSTRLLRRLSRSASFGEGLGTMAGSTGPSGAGCISTMTDILPGGEFSEDQQSLRVQQGSHFRHQCSPGSKLT